MSRAEEQIIAELSEAREHLENAIHDIQNEYGKCIEIGMITEAISKVADIEYMFRVG